jgi:hypothetical protein
LAQEILASQVLVETEDLRRIVIEAADVMTVLKRGGARSKPSPPRENLDESEGAESRPRPEPTAAPDRGEDAVLDEQE